MKQLLYAGSLVVAVVGTYLDGHLWGDFFVFGLACYLLGGFTVIMLETLREEARDD